MITIYWFPANLKPITFNEIYSSSVNIRFYLNQYIDASFFFLSLTSVKLDRRVLVYDQKRFGWSVKLLHFHILLNIWRAFVCALVSVTIIFTLYDCIVTAHCDRSYFMIALWQLIQSNGELRLSLAAFQTGEYYNNSSTFTSFSFLMYGHLASSFKFCRTLWFWKPSCGNMRSKHSKAVQLSWKTLHVSIISRW